MDHRSNGVIGRFAPSPTGRMHLGNIYSALLSYLSAKSKGGKWLLRIEDIDPQRSRAVFAEQAQDDLLWLGLQWDGEPVWQSERSGIYEEHLERLKAMGLTYPCYCTRADILATQAPHESDGRVVYAGTCRSYMNGSHHPEKTPSIRLMVEDEDILFEDGHYGLQKVNLASHCGDFIVRRSDGAWAYQLAVVVDDALMGVTEVVRGCDLLLSSAQQIYLYRKLGYDIPRFCHLPLLCNEANQRLSKRDRSLDMGCLRQAFSPQELLGKLAYSAGLTETAQPVDLQQLVKTFDWRKVPTENVVMNTTDWRT